MAAKDKTTPILTEHLIDEALRPFWSESVMCKTCGNVRQGLYMLSRTERDIEVAKAQRLLIAEWGKEFCPHTDRPFAQQKHECPECWAELEKGV